MEHSEQERLKQANAKGEFIHRRSDEKLYEIETPRRCLREPYPWEKGDGSQSSSFAEAPSVQL